MQKNNIQCNKYAIDNKSLEQINKQVNKFYNNLIANSLGIN